MNTESSNLKAVLELHDYFKNKIGKQFPIEKVYNIIQKMFSTSEGNSSVLLKTVYPTTYRDVTFNSSFNLSLDEFKDLLDSEYICDIYFHVDGFKILTLVYPIANVLVFKGFNYRIPK